MKKDLPLLRTFVDGLDSSLGGGIPQGSVVLIAGTPGTMKSSLVFHILYHNASLGHKGLFVTLEQSADSLKEAMRRIGLRFIDESRLYVLDLAVLRASLHHAETTKDWIAILMGVIKEAVAGNGSDILALDSLEVMYALSNMENPRREMFQLFTALKELGLTTFLIAETPFGSNTLTEFGEDFLADGILQLRHVEVGETDVQLRIRIVKMRMMRHVHNYLALTHDGERFVATPVLGRKK